MKLMTFFYGIVQVFCCIAMCLQVSCTYSINDISTRINTTDDVTDGYITSIDHFVAVIYVQLL